MRLHENIDFTTLTWVKPELDETLRQARNALQNYVEEGESPAELRTCSDLLHQVQGTLRMVELYGAAMVAEEMEQLSRALVDGQVENRDNAYAVLMQGIVQLPDYLERLQSGHRDIPIVLLPLLNQLRASRGEKGLNESVLFSPDLSRPLPPSAQGPGVPLDHAELTRRAEALRGLFQGALLRWLKDDNSAATIRDLTDVCEQLVPITSAEPARRLFWVAAGTLDALGKNAFPISNPLKQALAKVEREIKRLAEGGDAAFRTDPPIELTKQLLYFVAHEGSDVGRIGEIRKVFGLSGSEPSEAELAHARGSLSGNNRALLETVAVAIKEDLLRVKDSLDLHLRTPGAKPADLNAQVEALDRVADTLGMLGLAVPRRVVQDQRSAITDVINGQRRDDEDTLLDIAGALLYVEAALDDQVERLGKEGAEVSSDTATGTSNESRRLLEVLVKEAIVNFSQARQSFVGFVETHWDHRQLVEVPRLLSEVSGALRILNLPVPADYLVGVRQFTDNELLRRKHVPSGQQMDRLADALASLEYFLEALRDRRPNRDQILEVARQSLTSLGYWPLSAENRSAAPTAAPTPISKASAPVVPAAQPAPVASDAAPQAPATPAEVAVEVSLAAPAFDLTPATSVPETVFTGMVGDLVPGFDGASNEEIDDEIRDVFLEEFEEEIENLAQLLPPWRQDPANAELLRPIRRVFHTLKGSGRLVGAKTLGEFSWKIEGMLNRVLDGSRAASPEAVAIVQLALQHLPLLRAALQGQEVFADLEGIQATADRVAAGEDITYRHASMAEEVVDTDEDFDDDFEEAVADVEAAAPEQTMAEGEDEGPLFSIDPVLLEILKPEVAGHLEVVDAWLAQCAARGPQPVTDPLLRSIHTMNGAFAMTEVLAITDVTAPLEGFVKRSLAHNLNPGESGVALVADAAKAIRATILAIEKPRPVLPHFADLSARAYSLRDNLPDSMLPSVPVHAEEDLSPMPQVVVMEAADTSGIPDFEGMADVEAEAEVEAVAEAEVEAEAEIEAEIEAEMAIESELPVEVEVEVEAELPVEIEAERVEAEVIESGASELDAEAEMEVAQYLGSDAFIEPTVEPGDAAEAEAMPELESRADSWITGEYEIASLESPAAPAVEIEASSRTIVQLPADEPMQWSQEFEADQAAFEAEAAEALADVPTESFSNEQALEAQAQAEAADFAEEFELAEAAAVEELAPAEAELEAEVQAAEEFDLATEAEAVAEEAEEKDEQVAHAELFSADLISVEDFLREAGDREAAEATAAAAEVAAAEAAATAAAEAAAAAAEAEAAAAEAKATEAAATEAAEAAAAAAEAAAAAAEAAAAEAAAAEAAAAEAAAAEAAAEAAAAEAAAAEAAAAEAAAEAAAAEAAAAELAAAEAVLAAESLAQPADESLDTLSDSTLAGMIAAYTTDEEAQAVANVEAADAFILSDEFRDDIAASEAMAGAGGERVTPASMQGEADEPASVQVAIGDEYYGMSLAELEAHTSSGAARMAEADGFADLPTISDVPAWTSGTAPELEADSTSPALASLELATEFADLEALASSNFDLDIGEPEAAPASDFETVAAFDFIEEAPEPIVEVEAVTESAEIAEIAEDQTLGEVEDVAAIEAVEQVLEAESFVEMEVGAATDDEPVVALEIAAEAEQAAEPEVAAEAELPAEPEVVAGIEQEAELVFEDSPEEIAEAAVAASPGVVAAEPVRQQRPSVPMAVDQEDPDADLDMSDLDPELLDLFLEESNDILDHCDGVLARLREQAEDRDSIVTLQRDLHTLKGGARMAGIYAVGELGHAMESLLESVAEGRQQLDQTGVVVLERGFDRLHGMVARIGERKAVSTPVGLIAQVEALSEGRSLDLAVGAETVAATTPAPVRPRIETATLEALSAPMDELGAEDEMTGVRAPQEQVRIRADLLDRLVNYAGEVAIYRARLEQQLGAFRSNLGELNQTTTRLREQLRRLDIETEAQIIARYQREGEANDERFDPLELDRFTNQQQLTRALNESANDLVNLQGVLDELTRQYETLLLQQSRVSSDLQEGLMRTRMVPFDALVPRLRRVLRQAATDTGKQVQLKVDGASGEMDRNVLDRMTAPLEHMLRNAMAHGLELPDDRRKARKPEEGTVRIAVHREGSEVVLKVSDDGIGLNKKAIRDKALERGLIKPDAELSDEALYSLILETGFSTAETVSRLSGRGVGMDVVYSEIRQLGGTLQIHSTEGQGSEFVIRLPFTLAVTQAVFVKIGDTSFAVPIASVQGVGRIARTDLDKQLASDNPVFSYAGEDYAIHDLGTLIGHTAAKAQDSLQMPLLLARSGELRTAISIDQVLGSREIVVKPVGPQVNSVPGIFGATIMGDGRVVVILDVAPLVRRHTAIIRDITPVALAPVVAARRVPVVLVVDDSITMRKVTGRVLERNNMEVLTAKDGVDAVEKMAERVPDLVLLDIEMPRMDGYEVAQNMKSDPRLKDVPIIMITSRTGEKHRQRAMDIGVDRYLGKPYQEPELMRNVFEMLGLEAVNG